MKKTIRELVDISTYAGSRVPISILPTGLYSALSQVASGSIFLQNAILLKIIKVVKMRNNETDSCRRVHK